jgi:uncharacterized protein with ParB-like and HNH nuclease domain
MREIDIKRKQYTIADFLSWKREGTLELNPPFQRRSVWKPGARSYFLDTVVRGLPAPIIYLRERVDLSTRKPLREVVDGQQRLRTVLGFIEPKCLKDYDAERDYFAVKKIRNQEIANTAFNDLSDH